MMVPSDNTYYLVVDASGPYEFTFEQPDARHRDSRQPNELHRQGPGRHPLFPTVKGSHDGHCPVRQQSAAILALRCR